MRAQEKLGELGTFILGALVGAGLALLLTSESGAERRHDLIAKFKKLLHMRHNGMPVNGYSTPTRRHKRA